MPQLQASLRSLVKQQTANRLRLVRTEETAEDPKDRLSKTARTLLDLASLHRFVPTAGLWTKVKTPSLGVQNKAAEELQKAKLADVAVVRVGRMNLQLIDILEEGWQYLRKQPPARTGRGGMVHRHFQAWIAQAGRRQGYVVDIEGKVPGTNHPCDVIWTKNGIVRCFEVVAEFSDNLPSHIRTCMTATPPIESLIVVAGTRKEIAAIEMDLRAHLAGTNELARVQFDVIEHYMEAHL